MSNGGFDLKLSTTTTNNTEITIMRQIIGM